MIAPTTLFAFDDDPNPSDEQARRERKLTDKKRLDEFDRVCRLAEMSFLEHLLSEGEAMSDSFWLNIKEKPRGFDARQFVSIPRQLAKDRIIVGIKSEPAKRPEFKGGYRCVWRLINRTAAENRLQTLTAIHKHKEESAATDSSGDDSGKES